MTFEEIYGIAVISFGSVYEVEFSNDPKEKEERSKFLTKNTKDKGIKAFLPSFFGMSNFVINKKEEDTSFSYFLEVIGWYKEHQTLSPLKRGINLVAALLSALSWPFTLTRNILKLVTEFIPLVILQIGKFIIAEANKANNHQANNQRTTNSHQANNPQANNSSENWFQRERFYRLLGWTLFITGYLPYFILRSITSPVNALKRAEAEGELFRDWWYPQDLRDYESKLEQQQKEQKEQRQMIAEQRLLQKLKDPNGQQRVRSEPLPLPVAIPPLSRKLPRLFILLSLLSTSLIYTALSVFVLPLVITSAMAHLPAPAASAIQGVLDLAMPIINYARTSLTFFGFLGALTLTMALVVGGVLNLSDYLINKINAYRFSLDVESSAVEKNIPPRLKGTHRLCSSWLSRLPSLRPAQSRANLLADQENQDILQKSLSRHSIRECMPISLATSFFSYFSQLCALGCGGMQVNSHTPRNEESSSLSGSEEEIKEIDLDSKEDTVEDAQSQSSSHSSSSPSLGGYG